MACCEPTHLTGPTSLGVSFPVPYTVPGQMGAQTWMPVSAVKSG